MDINNEEILNNNLSPYSNNKECLELNQIKPINSKKNNYIRSNLVNNTELDNNSPLKVISNITTTIFNNRYDVKSNMILGKGSFGEIYITKDILSRNFYALKLESIKSKQNQLKLEKHVLDTMNNIEGFPKVISFGKHEDNNYLIMELLGPSLSDLFIYCNQKFTLQTVLLIAIQILTRVQDLHSKNYLHRDIKPENFLLGLNNNSNILYCIDFGLSKKYKDLKIDNIPYKENRSLVGTARYASINNHLGIEQSRRDDLESIGYLIIYLIKRKLPWQGCYGSTKIEKYNKILEKKLSISSEILCKDLPIEFTIYLNYVKNLKYNERPDYNFLKSIFFNLLCKYYSEPFLFDWTIENPFNSPYNLKENMYNKNNSALIKILKYSNNNINDNKNYIKEDTYSNNTFQKENKNNKIKRLYTINKSATDNNGNIHNKFNHSKTNIVNIKTSTKESLIIDDNIDMKCAEDIKNTDNDKKNNAINETDQTIDINDNIYIENIAPDIIYTQNEFNEHENTNTNKYFNNKQNRSYKNDESSQDTLSYN